MRARDGQWRRATYRRWVVATTVGELVAFSVPMAVWGSAAAAGLDERATLVPVVAAGAAEGAILAYAQSRALRHDLPALDVRRWIARTAIAGGLAWTVGMTAGTFHDELSGLPVPVLVGLGGSGAVVLLCSIGGRTGDGAAAACQARGAVGDWKRARLAGGAADRVRGAGGRARATGDGARGIRGRRWRGYGRDRRVRHRGVSGASARTSAHAAAIVSE